MVVGRHVDFGGVYGGGVGDVLVDSGDEEEDVGGVGGCFLY